MLCLAENACRGEILETDETYLRRGTVEFRRANLALFAAGFATFVLLYCVQPLMPVFAAEFGVSAAASSLSLSLTTLILAPMLIVAHRLSTLNVCDRLMVFDSGRLEAFGSATQPSCPAPAAT